MTKCINDYAKINKTITTLLILFFIFYNPYSVGSNEIDKTTIKLYEKNKIRLISEDSLVFIKQQLEYEIASHINTFAPTSKLSPQLLMEICKKNNFDLILAMSQAHIESHFGTKGMAAKTNSVFNVGTYDDGTIKYRYKHPNHSIEPYTTLINKNYLRDGKTTNDILKTKSFVNHKGRRYASFKHYEYRVKKIYDSIIEDTYIDDLYKIYTSEEYERSAYFYDIIKYQYQYL